MPACPKPNKKAAKLAYKILNTPKDMQQGAKETKEEVDRRIKAWFRDSSASQ